MGYWDAAVSTLEGATTAILHPIVTVQGIGSSIYHYDETFDAIKEGVTESTRTNRGIGSRVGNGLIGVATGGTIKSATTAIRASKLEKIAAKLDDIAPKVGVSSIMQGGRVVGTRLTSAEFDALRATLRSDDVWLSVGKLDSNGNVVIKFRPNELGRAELHLPSTATHYEKLHELGHFEHWKSLGKNYDEWIKLSQVDRECWVLDWMCTNHWNTNSNAERKNAIEQLLHALREAGEL